MMHQPSSGIVGGRWVTPFAVIHRYLQLLTQPRLDVDVLCQLIAADADLLAKWLTLLRSPVSLPALESRVHGARGPQFAAFAQAQSSSVALRSGSARLSVDQWLSVLHAACLAEALAKDVAPNNDAREDGSTSTDVRMRTLLAMSGVHLPFDERMVSLSRYRGVRPELLEDASLDQRILAVVDSLERGQERVVAAELLGISDGRFDQLLIEAAGLVDEILGTTGLDVGSETDWEEQIWMRQQVSGLCAALPAAGPIEDFARAHEYISRSLFPLPVQLWFVEEQTLSLLPSRSAQIALDSRSSGIAAAVRDNRRVKVTHQADAAVADRQALDRLGARSGVSLPLSGENGAIGALLVPVDEDSDHDELAGIYAEMLAQSISRLEQFERPAGEGQGEGWQSFREQEVQRLRELVHEANNPLSIVQNYLHILQLKLRHEPEAMEQLEVIGAELRRATEIFARARNVPQQFADDAIVMEAIEEQGSFDLTSLASRAAELHQGYAQDRHVSIARELPGSLVTVVSSPGAVAQIVTNLLRNAIEASHRGGGVTLAVDGAVYRNGVAVAELSVRDEGPGLPTDVLQQLFAPKVSEKGDDHHGVGCRYASDWLKD